MSILSDQTDELEKSADTNYRGVLSVDDLQPAVTKQ